MEITRRNLLGASAAVGAGLLLPMRIPMEANAAVPLGVTPFTDAMGVDAMGVATFTETLPTLTEMGVIDATGGRSATITMVSTSHDFGLGVPTPTFAYQGGGLKQDYLGPVIVAKRNVPFELTVVNNLGDHPLADAIDYDIMGTVPADATHPGDGKAPRAAVHLHGGNTAAADDGDPLDFFGVGAKNTYHYGNTQEAAGLWFHDHALGITRLNVFAGLAGGYLLRDANDTGDGHTLPAPPYEVPLVLQDRAFQDPVDGISKFDYPPAPWEPEFFGNVATVNGKITPNLNVDKGKYRFRVFNGSNARFYNLRFMSGAKALKFFQIGTDGGLLDRPVLLPALLISPGERADLVVDFACLKAGATVILTNDANAPYPLGIGDPLPVIMQFKGTGKTGWTKPLSARTDLRRRTAPITRLDRAKIDNHRSMSLVEVHDLHGNPTMVLMNNQTFMTTLDAPHLVKSNTLEEWDLINTTIDAHPMHLHFTQFQVLNRQKFNSFDYSVAAGYINPDGTSILPGKDVPTLAVHDYLIHGTKYLPAANELGWKDTIVCPPGEVTRIRIPFGPKAVPNRWSRGRYSPMAIGTAHTGNYVSHCHILEHEENDMMMRFKIVK